MSVALIYLGTALFIGVLIGVTIGYWFENRDIKDSGWTYIVEAPDARGNWKQVYNVDFKNFSEALDYMHALKRVGLYSKIRVSGWNETTGRITVESTVK